MHLKACGSHYSSYSYVWTIHKGCSSAKYSSHTVRAYCIAGKFSGSFNLTIWRIWPLIAKLKFSGRRSVTVLRRQIKIRQLRSNGSFAKFSCYMVCKIFSSLLVVVLQYSDIKTTTHPHPHTHTVEPLWPPLGNKMLAVYIGVAFIEGLFCTQIVHLGPVFLAVIQKWPLFRGGR